jgi:iron-sulfur cluster repair protein YtfE (RIC family)
MTEHHVAMVERHILDRAHRSLERALTRIETTAEVAGTLDASGLAGVVASLLDELTKILQTHMEWEEQVCFPETDRLAATSWATRFLRVQHEQIRGSITILEADCAVLRSDPARRHVADLRAHLYALHAVLSSHLEQEERALLTLLIGESSAAPERLTPRP